VKTLRRRAKNKGWLARGTCVGLLNRARISVLSCPTLRRIAAMALLTLGLAHPTVADTIYKVVDEKGNVTFTDTPPGDKDATVEVHILRDTNTANAVSATPATAGQTTRPDEVTQYETHITRPASGSTIPMGPGDFIVQAEITPGLESGEQLILMLDGTPVSAPQLSPTWQLSNVFRGAHRLQVVRLSKAGEALSESPEHTVYVMRPSVNR